MTTIPRVYQLFLIVLAAALVLQDSALLAAPTTLKWQLLIGKNNPGSPAMGPKGDIFVAVNEAIFALRDQSTNAVLVSSNGFPKGVQGGVAVRPDGIAYLPGTALGPAGLLAFDFLHGSPAHLSWDYNPSNAAGFASTPAIAPDGTVYAVTGDGDLHAISSVGTRRWVYARGAAAANNKVSPAISADGTVYFRQFGSQIHAVSSTGTNCWSRELLYQINSSPCVGRDGTVYVCAGTRVFALKPADGTDRWPACLLNHTVLGSSPALGPDGTLFVGADQRLFAVDSKTGLQVASSYKTGGDIYSSPAIAADGTVYFGSNDRYFYAMRLTNGELTLLDRYETGDMVQSAPAIAPDGTVYVTSEDGNLYAFEGTVGPAQSAWPMFHQNAQRTGLAPRQSNVSITRSQDGSMLVQIQSSADRATVLESSSNLLSWSPMFTNTITTNLIHLTDPTSATTPHRFYRARTP